MRHTEKHRAIRAALRRTPSLSTRAIAKLTGTSQGTVAKIRRVTGTPVKRREVNGQRARGPRPLPRSYLDKLPDGGGFVYRTYDKRHQLLVISTAADYALRLATLSRTPWHREIAHTEAAYFDHASDALFAAREAIRNEEPKYNVAPRPRKVSKPLSSAAGSPTPISQRPPSPSSSSRDEQPSTTGLIKRPTGPLKF